MISREYICPDRYPRLNRTTTRPLLALYVPGRLRSTAQTGYNASSNHTTLPFPKGLQAESGEINCRLYQTSVLNRMGEPQRQINLTSTLPSICGLWSMIISIIGNWSGAYRHRCLCAQRSWENSSQALTKWTYISLYTYQNTKCKTVSSFSQKAIE